MTSDHQLHRFVRRHAERTPDRLALQWMENGTPVQRVTYSELEQRVETIAEGLKTCTEWGDRVLLALETGVDFTAAFLACQYAGRIAVPVTVPPSRECEARTRVKHIWQHCQGTAMVVSERTLASLAERPLLPDAAWSPRCIALRELEDRGGAAGAAGAVTDDTPHDIAFLQYTSGSTAKPKGVVVGQSNLIDNLEHIRDRFSHDGNSVGLIWLPPQHDMGLIGGILQPLFVGFPCSLMAPLEFVQRPVRWLEAISALRATTSGGPCFAYDLCLRRVREEDVDRLDLQSWRVAFVGAEKVRADIMARFAAKFAPAGFRSSAILACYGLAEATLMVSGSATSSGVHAVELSQAALADGRVEPVSQRTARNADGVATIESVSCGRIVAGHEAVIVDPDRCQRLPEGSIGELWLTGRSVARGYFADPAATQHAFAAQLADDDSGTRYLRTGDQAFVLDGQLHICGRYKTIVIVRGKKYASEDVEALLQREHGALVSHGGVAFSCDFDGEEQLVVVHEVERASLRRDFDEIRSSMQRALGFRLGLRAADIALVLPASLPRTTSGKLQRAASRDLYHSGGLRRVETLAVRAVPGQQSEARQS